MIGPARWQWRTLSLASGFANMSKSIGQECVPRSNALAALPGDQDKPMSSNRPFYTGHLSSGRKRSKRTPVQECVHRLRGAVVHFVLVFAIVAVGTLAIAAFVELWHLVEFLDRFDWNLGLASHFLGEHWARASAALEFAYTFILFLGGLGGIVSAIGAMVTGETATADLVKSFPKLAHLLRARD